MTVSDEVQVKTHAGRSALDLYLREIQRIEVLDPEEERELGWRILRKDRKAVEELVRRNLRFVVMVARPYARNDNALEDLVNEGNIGLIQAAERFDVRRGFRFISYAVWWIRNAIFLHLTEKSRTIRLPVGKVQDLTRLARTTDRLTQVLARDPSVDEIAQELRLAPEKVAWLRALPTQSMSLDEPVEGEESDFASDGLQDDLATSTEEQLIERLRQRDIRSCLGILDPRGADIVRRYYGLEGNLPESLETIGRSYGVTRERIRQLRDRAIWRLRTSCESQLLSEYAES